MKLDSLLNRYSPLIDDPLAFEESLVKPLPTCIWANPVKTSPKAVADFLQGQGIELQPLSWYWSAFRSLNWNKPGHNLGFITGWYHVQEEIALTAVEVLDPQPGERILDLCASPGGKTAQIAVRVGDTGTVVANEVQLSRLASLRNTLDRMGVNNVIVTHQNGATIALPPHSFDRVLVDVPCSGEGTIRKSQGRKWQPTYSEKIRNIQRSLLDQALKLVKPGGIIVYSTCTFAPEENEAVIDEVIGDSAFLESATIPHLKGLPGLQSWEGQSFRSDLVSAQRYFPHFNNTGGFFVARMRRTEANLVKDVPSLPPCSYSIVEDSQPLEEFCSRFGIPPHIFHDTHLWMQGKKTIWVANSASSPQECPAVETLGLPLLRRGKNHWKPTTVGLQRYGRYGTHNVIELEDSETVQAFLTGETQAISASAERGYIHVRYKEFELGCGLYSKGNLISQIPKNLRLSKIN